MKTGDSKQVQLSDCSCLFIDNDIFSNIFKTRMREIFKRSVFVESLERAIVIYSNETFDFIFINIDTPEAKQIDLPNFIRSSSANSLVRVIAITSSVVLNLKTKLTKEGFDSFVRKPFNSIAIMYALKTNSINKTTKTKMDSEKIILSNKGLRFITDFSCLYIDSYINDIKLFKKHLKKLKNVFVAKNTTEASDILNQEAVDFIVISLNLLQKYNGLEMVELLRKKHNLNNIPIIAVSANPLSNDYKKIVLKNFDWFIQKPLTIDKFIPILKKYFFK